MWVSVEGPCVGDPRHLTHLCGLQAPGQRGMDGGGALGQSAQCSRCSQELRAAWALSRGSTWGVGVVLGQLSPLRHKGWEWAILVQSVARTCAWCLSCLKHPHGTPGPQDLRVLRPSLQQASVLQTWLSLRGVEHEPCAALGTGTQSEPRAPRCPWDVPCAPPRVGRLDFLVRGILILETGQSCGEGLATG